MQSRMLALQDEYVNMMDVIQRQRDEHMNVEIHQLQLQSKIASTSGQQNQGSMIVEHLRGQLAMIKGSELNTFAESESKEVALRMENTYMQSEFAFERMKANQAAFEIKVMKEAMEKRESSTVDLINRTSTERKQLKDANLSLVEANNALKRENLLRAPMFGEEGAEIQEKIKDLERALQESQKEQRRHVVENARLKAEIQTSRYPYRSNSREGGLPTSSSHEEEYRNLKDEARYFQDEYQEMKDVRDEVYDWYSSAHAEFSEERSRAKDLDDVSYKIRTELSEAAAASSSSSTQVPIASKISRKEESKINVPPWPKINDLGLWKANLIQAIIVAANDFDQQPWIDWIKEAIDDPDPDKFVNSGI